MTASHGNVWRIIQLTRSYILEQNHDKNIIFVLMSVLLTMQIWYSFNDLSNLTGRWNYRCMQIPLKYSPMEIPSHLKQNHEPKGISPLV